MFGLEFMNITDFKVIGYVSDIQMAFVQRLTGGVPAELMEAAGTTFVPVEFTLREFYEGATRRVYLSGYCQCVCKDGKRTCEKCRRMPHYEKVSETQIVLPAGAPAFFPILAENVYEVNITRSPHDVVFMAMCPADLEYKRVGYDLLMNQTITIAEAIRGGEIDVVKIDEKVVKIKLDKLQGGIVRVKGEGFLYPGETLRGDLVVNVEIQFPGKLTEEQRRIVNEVGLF
jgi:DnaJ-class molecular chaperone